MAFITCWPAFRVATGFASAPAGNTGISFSQPSASFIDVVRSYSAASAGYAFLYASNFASHSSRAFLPFSLHFPHCAAASSGT